MYDNGLRDIAAQLERSINEAVRASADAISERAKSLCPKLGDSIKVYQEGSYAEVYSDADCAGAVEFGTPSVPPEPYLIPAFIAGKNEVVEKLTAAIAQIGE